MLCRSIHILCRAIHYRMAKTHRMPYLHRSFSATELTIGDSFAKNDLQLKASYESSPPCMVYIQHPYTGLHLGFFYTQTDIDLHYYPHLILRISTMKFILCRSPHISCRSIHILCRAIHYRMAKTHRMPYLRRSFSATELKSTGSFELTISGSFTKNDLQLKAPMSLRHPVWSIFSILVQVYIQDFFTHKQIQIYTSIHT